ncbi:hypothetical protein NRF20_00420 [Streptomyces sp. R-74717]|uniref:hypothetical protein n=1 Tax=Streptomyces TaxID=1883 RepID=UPI0037B12091
MRDLDLDAMPIPPSRSGIPPTLLYRRETLGRWTHWNTRQRPVALVGRPAAHDGQYLGATDAHHVGGELHDLRHELPFQVEAHADRQQASAR